MRKGLFQYQRIKTSFIKPKLIQGDQLKYGLHQQIVNAKRKNVMAKNRRKKAMSFYFNKLNGLANGKLMDIQKNYILMGKKEYLHTQTLAGRGNL